MSKIYLIGNAAEHYKEEVLDAFLNAEKELQAEGHEVVNLMGEFDWHNKPLPESLTTRVGLLLTCTHAYVLPNWQLDPLAKAELVIAETAGIKCTIALGAIQPHQLVFYNPK